MRKNFSYEYLGDRALIITISQGDINKIHDTHSFLSQKDKSYQNLIPVLGVLNKNDEKKLFEELDKLDFNINNLEITK